MCVCVRVTCEQINQSNPAPVGYVSYVVYAIGARVCVCVCVYFSVIIDLLVIMPQKPLYTYLSLVN